MLPFVRPEGEALDTNTLGGIVRADIGDQKINRRVVPTSVPERPEITRCGRLAHKVELLRNPGELGHFARGVEAFTEMRV